MEFFKKVEQKVGVKKSSKKLKKEWVKKIIQKNEKKVGVKKSGDKKNHQR